MLERNDIVTFEHEYFGVVEVLDVSPVDDEAIISTLLSAARDLNSTRNNDVDHFFEIGEAAASGLVQGASLMNADPSFLQKYVDCKAQCEYDTKWLDVTIIGVGMKQVTIRWDVDGCTSCVPWNALRDIVPQEILLDNAPLEDEHLEIRSEDVEMADSTMENSLPYLGWFEESPNCNDTVPSESHPIKHVEITQVSF